MTNTTTISYIACCFIASALIGVSFAQASEVTGTLSSDATSNTETSGNIEGTVSSGGGGGGGGGSSSSGGRSNRSNSSVSQPSGAVLGAATDAVSPGFPNAGFAPAEVTPVPTLWSRMVTFFSTIISS